MTEDFAGRFPERARFERELMLGVFLLLTARTTQGLVDPDLPGHLIFGTAHLASGALPDTDPYSYAIRGLPWTNHEWLFELLIAWIFAHLGQVGLVLLQVAVWSTTLGLLLRRVWLRLADMVPSAGVMLFVVALCTPAISVRPQMFTFLAFTVLLLLLERGRRGKPWGWIAAGLVFFPWVNLHGGFLAGLGVYGVYLAGLTLDAAWKRPVDEAGPPPSWRTLAWGAAGLLLGGGLTVLNPAGIGLHRFLVASLGKPRPMISEWAPTQLDVAGGVFVTLIALTAWSAFRVRQRVPWAHALALGVIAVMGLKHVRHQPFLAIAVAALMAREVGEGYRAWVPRPQVDLAPGQRRRLQVVTRVSLLTLTAGILLGPGSDVLRLRLRPDGRAPAPTGALEYIERHDLRGNLLVSFDWAQLMIGRHHDRFRVFFDGRFRTVYPASIEQDYLALQFALPGSSRALEAYPTELVLLSRELPQAIALLEAEPAWVEVYRSSLSALFVRRAGPYAHLDRVERPDPLPVLRFELAPITSGR